MNQTPRERIIMKGWILNDGDIDLVTLDEQISFFRTGNKIIIGDIFIYLKKYSESYMDEKKTIQTQEWASLPYQLKIDNFTQEPDKELLQKVMTECNIKDEPKTIWVHHYLDTTVPSALGGFRPVNREKRNKKSTTTTN